MCIGILLFKNFTPEMNVICKVIIEVLIGILIYGIMLFLLKEINKEELKNLVKEIKSRKEKC